MGKGNFQYDETGTTYYYVFLTFLGFFLFPATYYFWPFADDTKVGNHVLDWRGSSCTVRL